MTARARAAATGGASEDPPAESRSWRFGVLIQRRRSAPGQTHRPPPREPGRDAERAPADRRGQQVRVRDPSACRRRSRALNDVDKILGTSAPPAKPAARRSSSRRTAAAATPVVETQPAAQPTRLELLILENPVTGAPHHRPDPALRRLHHRRIDMIGAGDPHQPIRQVLRQHPLVGNNSGARSRAAGPRSRQRRRFPRPARRPRRP